MSINSRHLTDGPRLALPTGVEVTSFDTYLEAQRAVDHLSDEGHPVQKVSIVGTDLRMVEKVLGRLTYGRAAASGAMSGSWFGLLMGLLFVVLSGGSTTSVAILAAVLMGAAFGLLWGLAGYALRSRERDFTSTSQVVASRYAIVADREIAARVEEALGSAGLLGHRPDRPAHVRRVEHGPVEEEPRYGIRLAPGQRVEDVIGRPVDPDAAPVDPRDAR